MSLNWNGPADVGVKEFNEQHQNLINLFYDLLEAIVGNKSYEKIGGLLASLIAYADYHFSTEEKYLKRYAYPETDEHLKEHAYFKATVLELQNNFNYQELKTSLVLVKFLERWINNHIIGTDGKYGKFFNQMGIY